MLALALRVFGLITAAVLFLGYWEEIARVSVDVVFYFVTAETLDDPLWEIFWKNVYIGATLLTAISIGSVPVLVAECLARMCMTRARRRWETLRDGEVDERCFFNRLRWEFQQFLRNRR